MKFAVHQSESLEFVRSLPDASVDCVVMDPPYGLGKEPDALAMLRDWMTTGHHDHKGGGGFMGKKWDAFVPQPAFWAECFRVMKPGAHLVTFGGTRTFDLVTLGLRIAGFEVRDVLAWMYGSGFPKSLDVSKAIDKAAGAVLDEMPNSEFRMPNEEGASRFFYCAKASRSEREAGLREAVVGTLQGGGEGADDPVSARFTKTARNVHPTVKPIALMRWLVRLVTPPGGTVHDFFTGSGTTGCAAMLEGFDFTGCDREADYVEIARARIEFWRKASPSHVQAEFGEFSGVGK